MKSKKTTMFEAIGDQGLMTDGDWIESKDQDLNGDVRLIQLADIGDGVFLNKSRKYVTSETVEKLRCTLIKKGDVLIARMPDPLGRACVFPDLKQPAITAVDICIVRTCRNDINPDWLAYYLNSPDIRLQIQNQAQGATRARVPTGKLKKLDVQIPSITDQCRIAARLKSQLAEVEKARKAAEVQIADAEALSAGYLREAFEGKNMEQWLSVPLGDAGEVASGITLGRKTKDERLREVPYLRVANVKDGYLDLAEIKTIEATEKEIEKWRLQADDILLTEGGDPDKLGRGTFWSGELPECIHQNHIFRVRFPSDKYLPEFISAQIGSPYGKTYFLAHAKKTTGIATINQKVLKAFPLFSPPLEKQKEVMTCLSEKLKETQKITARFRKRLDEISILPNRLLSQAFDMD